MSALDGDIKTMIELWERLKEMESAKEILNSSLSNPGISPLKEKQSMLDSGIKNEILSPLKVGESLEEEEEEEKKVEESKEKEKEQLFDCADTGR